MTYKWPAQILNGTLNIVAFNTRETGKLTFQNFFASVIPALFYNLIVSEGLIPNGDGSTGVVFLFLFYCIFVYCR